MHHPVRGTVVLLLILGAATSATVAGGHLTSLGFGSRPGGEVRAGFAAGGLPVPLGPPVTPPPVLRVSSTLVLVNNTVVPGNFPAVNGGPAGIAFDSGKSELFVAEQGPAGGVVVVNDTSDMVVAAIPTGQSPFSVVYDRGRGEMFVTNAVSPTGTVDVINDTSNEVVATIPAGNDSLGAAYDNRTGEVFVANVDSNTVSVISDSINSVVATIPLRGGPSGVAFDSRLGEIFVTNTGSNDVSVISDSTNSVIATIPVGGFPQGVAYDSGRGETFVANLNSENVSVIDDDSNAVVATVSHLPGLSVEGMVYDPLDGEVFAATTNLVFVDAISDSSNTVVATTGESSLGVTGAYVVLALDPTKGLLFLAGAPAGSVGVIAATSDSVTGSVAVAAYPQAVTYDSGNGRIFVANRFGGVDVVSDTLHAVIASIPGLDCTELVFDSAQGKVLCMEGDRFPQYIIAINDTTYQTTTVVELHYNGGPVWGVAYDPGKGELFVADSASGNVTVIDDTSNTVVTSIDVGGRPVGLAYDEGRGEVFVAGTPGGFWGNENVSVINDTSNSVVASVTVGVAPSGIVYDPVHGDLFVADASNVSVISDADDRVVGAIPTNFSLGNMVYDPAGEFVFDTGYSSSNLTVISSTSDSLATNLSVGSQFPWTGYLTGMAYDSGTSEVYVANPGQGTISIVTGIRPIGTITFREKGLPRTTKPWAVDFNGTLESSSAHLLEFVAPNGSYPYLVRGPAGFRVEGMAPGGLLAVSGANFVQTVTFVRGATYNLSFHQTGLGPGTSWCVTIGSTACTTGSTLTLRNFTAATYGYAIGSVPGLTTLVKFAGRSQATPGVLSVPAERASEGVFQIRFAFPVRFVETGLPAGHAWSVTGGGLTGSSTGSTIELNLTNGTYSFWIHLVPGYLATPGSGRISVAGAPVSATISFSARGHGPALTDAETTAVWLARER
jgi:YVTN family beta-propeller protein